MDNRDLSGIGEQIRKSVETALDSMNFEQLNKNISDSVGSALDEARKSVKSAAEQAGSWSNYGRRQSGGRDTGSGHRPGQQARADYKKKNTFENTNQDDTNQGQLNWEMANERGGNSASKTGTGSTELTRPAGVRVNYPSRVAGILYTVFGSIGIGVFGILFIVFLLIGIFTRSFFGVMAGSSIIFLILGAAFGVMLGIGRSMLGRIKRLKAYLKEAGDRIYCSVEDLTCSVGKSRKFVIKDVERMISGGILPEARWDDKKTCLMLNREAYRQYQEAQRGFEERKRREEAGRKGTEVKQSAVRAEEDKLPEELRKMIASGREYVRTLREANDAIPGEEISAKLTRLETTISQIFESVERHPEQADGMERFMEYYLPTTVKLVNAYRDFDSVDAAGGNVASAKQEIENTLDTINQAFERLLDDLYSDVALDASTDASVLQTMLKKDGFADSDFK